MKIVNIVVDFIQIHCMYCFVNTPYLCEDAVTSISGAVVCCPFLSCSYEKLGGFSKLILVCLRGGEV